MTNFQIADSHNDFLSSNYDYQLINKDFKKNNIALCNAILFSKNKELNIKKSKKIICEINKQKYLSSHCVFSFENLTFLKEKDFDKLISFQPFSCSLTWNYDNQFAGGAIEFGALTLRGINLIKLMNKHNIILDTAHLNRQSFWQAIKYTTLPIFNSHTCYNLIEHRRNLDIEQIKAIIDTNGFIGITFVSSFLSHRHTSSSLDVFKNIDAIIQKFGINNIGIGTDFYGTNQLPQDLKKYDDFVNLYFLFKKYKYTDNDINKIFSQNFIKFVKNNYKHL